MAAIPPSALAAISATHPTSVPTIRLGNALFYPYELPGSLAFKLEQRIATQEFIGGGRFVQPIGAQHEGITWKGVIRSNYPHDGMSASDRADELLRMVAIGKQVKLSWLSRARYVVPQSFEMDYAHENKISYTISLVVVRDISGTTSVAMVPSADSQVAALFDRSSSQATALTVADPTAATLGAQVSAAAKAVSQSGPIASQVGTSTGKKLLATVQTTLASAQTYLGAIGQRFPRSHIANARSLVTSLSLITSQMQAGQSVRSVIVSGGTIEDVALRELGDITLSRALQRANNLPSSTIEQGVLTKLVIPPFGSV